MTVPPLSRNEFERDDFDTRCIFTGVPVKKKRGEHVIPRWLIADNNLHDRNFEMGESHCLAAMKVFRAPAEPNANGEFGKLENRVKLGKATRDELHLWQKKISVGMALNHWHLSQNDRHPSAPHPIDPRYLVFALKDFQEEFKKLIDGHYTRTGSTLILPTEIPAGWMAHAFGATVQGLSETHDGLLPYGLVAVSHGAKLIVSALHDPEQVFESDRLVHAWESKDLHKDRSPLRIQAALAVTYAEYMVSAMTQEFGEKPELEPVLQMLAYQLGIKVAPDTRTFFPR